MPCYIVNQFAYELDWDNLSPKAQVFKILRENTQNIPPNYLKCLRYPLTWKKFIDIFHSYYKIKGIFKFK